MSTFREFFVGDEVRVVDTPYMDCPFSWIDDMTKMCGKVATITRKQMDTGKGTYFYNIRGSQWNWCGNCFMPLEPEEELPEIEDDSFLKAIRMGG